MGSRLGHFGFRGGVGVLINGLSGYLGRVFAFFTGFARGGFRLWLVGGWLVSWLG